ncbi:saccharopine dehydrogenase family protein [Halalkalibacter alkaliphilus]|uniref:Saccharopine dehydrogenase NADP-binding domain-containing protein n=1 Tax=Halalkalibacter alkaliphilus TaxID=2917993 RepID=A0A9X2CWY1_9BACI|nr:saccharopine dehydrogenase C-terminal domain-containing protein [Halalkalibacter alkaliphilus]MCL7749600.1 saccharopine dehydrogenase NADP-binding domain-containing protein [Halalkalibacter alkaliphilus]
MKIAVLGGAGKVVLGAIQDFVENKDVKEVFLGDINLEALEARKQRLSSGKVTISQIDLNNHHELVEVLRQYDACLNGSSHHFNIKVMKACLQAKTHYTDFGGLFHWAREQLQYNDEFKREGITGIVGSGSAPGIVNVMARYAYDRLDKVHSVAIRDGIVNRNLDENDFTPPYAIETLLDEYMMNPFVYTNGEFRELNPFEGEEVVDFPHPIGTQSVIPTIHSEVATMPISFKEKGIQHVSFKLALPKEFEEKLRFVVSLGFGSNKPIDIKGTEVIPRKVLAHLTALNVAKKTKEVVKHDDHKALQVVVIGEKEGKASKYIMDCVISPYEKWPHMSQGVFSVGFPAAVTTRLLASGQIKERGFFASEGVIPTQLYFDELAKRGIRVESSFIQQV